MGVLSGKFFPVHHWFTGSPFGRTTAQSQKRERNFVDVVLVAASSCSEHFLSLVSTGMQKDRMREEISSLHLSSALFLTEIFPSEKLCHCSLWSWECSFVWFGYQGIQWIIHTLSLGEKRFLCQENFLQFFLNT